MRRISIKTAVVIFGMIVFFQACSSKQEQMTETTAENNVEQEKESAGTPEADVSMEDLPGNSIFLLESRWATENGDSVQLKHLYGKPFVMAMIYTHCPYACPRIIGDMKEIESEVPEKYLDDVHFLMVSIDPEQDTPDTLKTFMNEKELDAQRWVGLVSNKDNIQDLAAAIGFNYKKTSAMDFAHSNLITVFDAKGRQVHQTEGFDADKEGTVKEIIKAVEENKPPS